MSENAAAAPVSDLDKLTEIIARTADTAVFTADVAESPTPAKCAPGARRIAENLTQALALLDNMGGNIRIPERTSGGRPIRRPDTGDLGGLRSLDTSAGRELVELLQRAAEVGARVDRERGALDEHNAPTGWGEWLGEIATKARLEVYGHPGSGRE